MDNKGLIFTTDTVLALVIFIVFSAAFITYYIIPMFSGQDQQSLDAIAADALQVMQQDGTLLTASTYYARGEGDKGRDLLRSSLNYLIPSNIGYRLTLGFAGNPSVSDSRGVLVANDVASRVVLLSAPEEGWMGRAWYKLEKAEFEEQPVLVTSTLWNFHNWLTNFAPWNSGSYLFNNQFWGRGNTSQNINFSVPQNSNMTGAYFLIGSQAPNNLSSLSANLTVNGNLYHANRDNFTFLNYRPTNTNIRMYNYRGLINPAHLSSGINNYLVRFHNFTNTTNGTYRYDLPWFAIIGNYTTSYKVPKGVFYQRFNFNDAAGLAVPTAQNLGGTGNVFGRIYNLQTGSVTSLTQQRQLSWATFTTNRNSLDAFSDGVPFVWTNLPNVSGTAHGSAVSITRDFTLPENIRILDSTLVMNVYGGVDNAMVEVWNGTNWRCLFVSSTLDGVTYSDRTDGYGNIPGSIYIPTHMLRSGNNRVRITVWDHVPSSDYDLAGLVDCYVSVSYSRLPIVWTNFPFNSYQSNTNNITQERSFSIEPGAREAYLFVGTGVDSRNLRVQVRNSTSSWVDLYPTNTTIPYYLNLASLDAVAGRRVFTTANSTPTNYNLRPGNYTLRVSVTGPSNFWESGDWDGNAEIFSGTRVAILYPEFLQNVWTVAYSSNAAVAQETARERLIQMLSDAGYTVDTGLIKSEALYTGNLPNNIPVRLDLWRQ